MHICDILATILVLAAILEFRENNFQKNGFIGLKNIQFDLFYGFLRHLQAKIRKFPEFGGHLGKTANRKKMLNIWSLAPNGFGFSSSKPNGNHHKSLYMSQNKVQLPKAWITLSFWDKMNHHEVTLVDIRPNEIRSNAYYINHACIACSEPARRLHSATLRMKIHMSYTK